MSEEESMIHISARIRNSHEWEDVVRYDVQGESVTLLAQRCVHCKAYVVEYERRDEDGQVIRRYDDISVPYPLGYCAGE